MISTNVLVEYKRGFIKDTQKLNKSGIFKENNIYDLVEDFMDNQDKNSYDNKLIKGRTTKNLWQIRVNHDYRILYLKYDDKFVFQFIGKHNLVEKVINRY